MQKINIAVLGAGNMGTALAQILARNGHRVRLWDYNPDTVAEIVRTGANEQFLSGVKLSRRIVPETDMARAVEKAQLVIVACASPYVRQVGWQLNRCLIVYNPPQPSLNLMEGGRKNVPPLRLIGSKTGRASAGPGGEGELRAIAHIAKGLEPKTNLTMHEVVQSELPGALRRSVVTISGPSIAKELVAGVPTAVVAASQDKKAAELVQKVFTSTTFKVTISRDWKGVSICGALKNVYAIALGMCDPVRARGRMWRPTSNGTAWMFSAAVQEMEQIVTALGGKRETVHGLAGIGDLVVTGLGQGRNRALGERICRDGSCEFLLKDKGAQTHEGVAATKVFYDLTRRSKIKTPLVEMVYRVLYKGADPCKAVHKFFQATRI